MQALELCKLDPSAARALTSSALPRLECIALWRIPQPDRAGGTVTLLARAVWLTQLTRLALSGKGITSDVAALRGLRLARLESLHLEEWRPRRHRCRSRTSSDDGDAASSDDGEMSEWNFSLFDSRTGHEDSSGAVVDFVCGKCVPSPFEASEGTDMPVLRRLVLIFADHNGEGGAGPIAMAGALRCAWLSGVQELRASPLTNSGVEVLAAAPMGALRDLDVGGSDLSPEVAIHVASASWAGGLTALRMSSARTSWSEHPSVGWREGYLEKARGCWQALGGAPLLVLRVLDVRGLLRTAEEADALAAGGGSRWLEGLDEVWVAGDEEGGNFREGDSTAAICAAAPVLQRLYERGRVHVAPPVGMPGTGGRWPHGGRCDDTASV